MTSGDHALLQWAALFAMSILGMAAGLYVHSGALVAFAAGEFVWLTVLFARSIRIR